MQKLTAVVLSLGLLATVAVAQEKPGAPPVQFGLKGGLTLSSTTGSIRNFYEGSGADESWRWGFGGGVLLRMPLNPDCAFHSEILYVMRGAEYKGNDIGITFKYDYIDIPIFLEITGPTEHSFRPKVFAGPNLSFLVSAKAAMESVSIDLKDYCETVSVGLAFGAGVDIVSQCGKVLTFDVRYTHGVRTMKKSISTIDETYLFPGGYEGDEQSGNLGLYLGYMFNL